ncbi:MAG: hypothetical protein KJP06_07770 [Deltaproteobacteria bacterium]|nr:hypothetical protein [Deltaproteobacteria bacterium]
MPGFNTSMRLVATAVKSDILSPYSVTLKKHRQRRCKLMREAGNKNVFQDSLKDVGFGSSATDYFG